MWARLSTLCEVGNRIAMMLAKGASQVRLWSPCYFRQSFDKSPDGSQKILVALSTHLTRKYVIPIKTAKNLRIYLFPIFYAFQMQYASFIYFLICPITGSEQWEKSKVQRPIIKNCNLLMNKHFIWMESKNSYKVYYIFNYFLW